jgi:hypothetical protein
MFWCTVTTPRPQRGCRAGRGKGPPFQPHLAGIGAMNTAQHLDQGGFSGAVRAHQHRDLPRRQIKVDPAQHGVAAESLGQPADGDGGFRHGLPHSRRSR